MRISAGTNADGEASVAWFDKAGKTRIHAGTFANGQASQCWLDKKGEPRIMAAILANGTVFLPKEEYSYSPFETVTTVIPL